MGALVTAGAGAALGWLWLLILSRGWLAREARVVVEAALLCVFPAPYPFLLERAQLYLLYAMSPYLLYICWQNSRLLALWNAAVGYGGVLLISWHLGSVPTSEALFWHYGIFQAVFLLLPLVAASARSQARCSTRIFETRCGPGSRARVSSGDAGHRTRLWTENLGQGQQLGPVQVVNPFL